MILREWNLSWTVVLISILALPEIAGAAEPEKNSPVPLPDMFVTPSPDQARELQAASKYLKSVSWKDHPEEFSSSDKFFNKLGAIASALEDEISDADWQILRSFAIDEPKHLRQIRATAEQERINLCASGGEMDGVASASSLDRLAKLLDDESSAYYDGVIDTLSQQGKASVNAYVENVFLPNSVKVTTDWIGMAAEIPEFVRLRLNAMCSRPALPGGDIAAPENFKNSRQ